VVADADGDAGMTAIAGLVLQTEAELVVVGVPVSLRGGEHGQAAAARGFAERLASRLGVPLTTYDERFTTRIAEARGGEQPLDARAAAVLLEDYLTSRRRSREDVVRC